MDLLGRSSPVHVAFSVWASTNVKSQSASVLNEVKNLSSETCWAVVFLRSIVRVRRVRVETSPDDIRDRLPAAEIIETDEDLSLDDALEKAASSARWTMHASTRRM